MTSNSNTKNLSDNRVTEDKVEGSTPIKIKKADRIKVLRSRLKRRILKHTWVVRIALLAGALIVLYFFARGVLAGFSQTETGMLFSLGKTFITASENDIDSISGNTNVLIMGKSGEGRDSPDLTDTIIFVSVDLVEGKLNTISVPRDIWMPSLRAKINSAYYWGNQKEDGGGIILARSAVEEVVGQPIHYTVVFDFDGFVEIVDALGGIEVDVESAFVDERYPIEGRENDLCGGDPDFACRYETIRFTQGKQFMDGERALKFVRSRNAEGDEGTDFARARRQTRVLASIKAKLLDRDLLMSPRRLIEIMEVLERNSETNINSFESVVLMRFLFNARDNISSHVIPEDMLINPPISPRYDNLYVFIPARDDPETPQHGWDEVHEWAKSVLER